MGLFDSIKEAFESDPQKLADWQKDVADLQAKLATASGNDATELQKEIDAKNKQISDIKAKLGIVDGPTPEAVAADTAAAQAVTEQAAADQAVADQAAASQAAYDATIAQQEAAAKAAADEAAATQAAAEAAKQEAVALAAAQAAPQYRTYEVKPGDTLSKIGREFGVSYTSIAELNGIENPDLIYPGQVFNIPN